MQSNDSITQDEYDEYDDGRYDNVAGLYDRFALAVTSIVMRAERTGWVSDDDILDAADRWALDERDAEGCFLRDEPADYGQLVEWLFEWLEQSFLPEGEE